MAKGEFTLSVSRLCLGSCLLGHSIVRHYSADKPDQLFDHPETAYARVESTTDVASFCLEQ